MVDGSFWLTSEGPYRTLAELWDDPEEDERQSKLVLAAYTNLNGKIHGVDMPTAKLNSGEEAGSGVEGAMGAGEWRGGASWCWGHAQTWTCPLPS